MRPRRFMLPRNGPTALGRTLRTVLHLTHPAAATRPTRAAAPLLVTVVAGVVAATVATGHAAAVPPSAATSAIGGSAAVAGSATSARPLVAPGGLVTQGDVVRALRALAVPAGRGQRPASRSESRAPLHRWVRPNWGPLSSPFGYRWGRLHAGIDLAGPYGSPIVAATDGCITYAGPEAGYGEVIMIADWDGTESVYGHMSAFVRHSGCVKAGQVIARVGEAGDATGPHLHFEVRVHGVPVDPIPFLAKRGVAI